MDVQSLINYEDAFQVDMGNILRDLALLMMLAEKGKKPDAQTHETVVAHLRTFSARLGQFEQLLQTEWQADGGQSDE